MTGKIELAITQTHINTLQNIITRLSNYSMNCKTWAVTIVSALCVVIFDPQKICYFYIVFIPIIIFWLFDCYYLGLEKTFRDIYDDFMINIKSEKTTIENDVVFSLKKIRLRNFVKAIFSFSTTPLYAALVVVVSILYFVIR
jgi:hypothetical protein